MITTRLKRYAVGISCLVVGVVGGVIPVLQGWIFIAAGLIILKDDVIFVGSFIKWLKKRFPKTIPLFSKSEEKVDALLRRWKLK